MGLWSGGLSTAKAGMCSGRRVGTQQELSMAPPGGDQINRAEGWVTALTIPTAVSS